MGLDVLLDIDYCNANSLPGDVFFLCSEGVYNFLHEADIIEALYDLETTAEDACGELIRLALANGSKENLSCQIVRVLS